VRRRWKVDTTLLTPLVVIWVVGGFVANLAIVGLYHNHDRHGHDEGMAWVHSPIRWTLPIWLCPFVLVLALVLLSGIPIAARWIWEHRPLRRVWESIEDMREHYKR